MSDDDLIRRGDALALFENYTGTQFWVQQITALPADDRVAKLVEALQLFIDQEVDYMTRNNLGDPEKQHSVRVGRAAIAAWEEGK
jgi:hypothetical protein